MDPDKRNLQKKLLRDYQRNFPLVERPFQKIAEDVGSSEKEVLEFYRSASERGWLGRIGAVVPPGQIGVSTLAAMAVPKERLESVADLVSSYPEVNHNYERENELNLWFVAHSSSEENLLKLFEDIQTRTGLVVLDLRLEEEFRIDLGFDPFVGESP